ncbi:MAG: porphobilinogen synthase [Sedimentisphaerales bacterium]|nr:porphobilinogen synthase [Sedimentisphaerales bacterium]
MGFPTTRLRRLRTSPAMRRLVAETTLLPADFVYPLFACPGKNVHEPIESMTDCYHLSPEGIAAEAAEAADLGIPAVLLFGLPKTKDAVGSEAWAPDNAVCQSIRRIRELLPRMLVITDVCLCAYTDHGHCGVVKDGRIDNDGTLELLAKMAVAHARAGADIVAPSDMMDGRVGAIRKALDAEGCTETAIMSYAAKYASAFYGPFRDAAHSAPGFGDRKTYQMDPVNARQALREIELDIEEGADIVMVKPALAYLDILYRARQRFDVPLAAYNVSGEYMMLQASAQAGLIHGDDGMMEVLTAIKRAGADIIITYHAKKAAQRLRS